MREVHHQASPQPSPNHSRETKELSGIDLMQEERRSNSIGLGMGVDVRNRLDTRKREG